MLNQIVLVGRLTKQPEFKKEGEKEYSVITLAIPRSYKNIDGVYETDFVDCSLYGNVAKNTCEYCNKGDVVGIKGRIESMDKKMVIIADRVTFLSSQANEINEEMENK